MELTYQRHPSIHHHQVTHNIVKKAPYENKPPCKSKEFMTPESQPPPCKQQTGIVDHLPNYYPPAQ